MERWVRWKTKPTFETKTNNYDTGYDILEDKDVIKRSFLYQYNIYLPKVKNHEMTFIEYVDRIAALDKDSPLARLVAIRLEDNQDIIKNFSDRDKKINNDWKKRKYDELITSDDVEIYKEQQRKRIAHFLDSCM